MKKFTSIVTVLLLTFIFTVSAKADIGDLFVQVDLADDGSGCSILQVKPDGTLINAVSNAAILAATGSGSADCEDTGLAIDNNGDVFFTDDSSDSILKFDQSSGTISTFITEADVTAVTGNANADFDNGLAFGPAGNLYAGDEESENILIISPSGVVSIFISEADVIAVTGAASFDPEGGIAVDRDGNVYVADDTTDSILKITPFGGISTLTSAVQIQAITGIDPDLDVGVVLNGALFVLDDADCGCLLKINVVTGIPELFVSAPEITAVTGNFMSDPEGGIAINFSGDIFIGDDGEVVPDGEDRSSILIVSPAGVVGTFVSNGQLINFYDTAEPGFDDYRLRGSMAIEGFSDRILPIPTLSEWGLIAMAFALGIIGFVAVRKRAVNA